MAVDKKFFVDINLQGNALNNVTIGSNSDMTKAGSLRFDGTRLEFYNGSNVQSVADLSDIAAVTGGLILQTGYDAATNTPDIADGSALKGYFWVVTTAGSFLGESVQVGDSIIAKVDNAGASIGDWLILQGNVVIATDTVDGIVRLATQAEVNDGTESGAVVVTPATLQSKIDSQITPEIDSKLPLAGGAMSGHINLNNNQLQNASLSATTLVDQLDADNNTISNLPAPSTGDQAANKQYVDDQDALKLSLTGGTMSGSIDMGGEDITNATYVYTDNLSSNSAGKIMLDNNLDAADVATIINLPAPTNGGDAANKTYVDGQAAAAQAVAEAYADSLAPNYDPAGSAATAESNANSYTDSVAATKLNLAGGTMSGSIDMGNSDISNVGAIYLTGGTVTGVPTPTDVSDAANKDYVDTAASTATGDANNYTDSAIAQEVTDRNSAIATAKSEAIADANTYTDTQIDAQSFANDYANTAWVLSGGVYTLSIAHNLDSYAPRVACYVSGDLVEFYVVKVDLNTIELKSNVNPPASVVVGVSK